MSKNKNLLASILFPPQAAGYYGRTSTPSGRVGDFETNTKTKADPRIGEFDPIEINHIKIGGFRRLKDIDLPVRPFMVLIGANGVGFRFVLPAQ